MNGQVSRIYQDLDLFTEDAESKLNNPLPTSVKVKPSLAWLEFLFATRVPLSKANEFLCVHDKFYWKTCRRCNRSPEGAKYWEAKLYQRLVEFLTKQS
jgi:hypothetical protein